MKLFTSTALLGVLLITPALAASDQNPQQSAQRLCQEWSQAFNSRDTNQIANLFTQDGIDVTPTAINQGQDQIRRRVQENLQTMSNFRCTVDQVEAMNSQGQIINGQGQIIPSSNQGSSSSSSSQSSSSSSSSSSGQSQTSLLWAVGNWSVQNRNQQTNQQQPIDGFWAALYQVQTNGDVKIRMLAYNQKADQNAPVGSSSSGQQNR